MSKNLTTRAEDYSKWYNELVVKADLAENSGVVWLSNLTDMLFGKKMQGNWIECLKRRASKCLLSVFVPKSMFEAEEKNAEGFAKECAIVTL
jgi:prolyl-tRNA synthetase